MTMPGFVDKIADFLLKARKRRALVYFLIAAGFVLPVILVSGFSYTRISQELTIAALSRRASIAYLSNLTLKEKFDRLTDISVSLATRVRFRQLVSEKKWDEAVLILRDVPRDFPFIDRAFIADLDGTLMADTPPLPGVKGQNFAFRDWYKGVSNQWKPYVSEIYKRTAKPQYNVIAVAAPIKSEGGNLVGILVLQVRLDSILEWSNNIDVGPGGFVYFVDKNGRVAGHPKYSGQEEPVSFSESPTVRKVLQKEKGIEILYDPLGREGLIAAYEPVSGYDWGAIVQQPTETAFATREKELNFILLVYGLIILFNSILAYLFLAVFHAINTYRQKENIFLESIGDGIVAIDRGWNIVLWNKAASNLSGWSKEEAIGKPLRSVLKFIKEKDRSENIAFIEEAMLFGRVGIMEDHTVLISKNNAEIPVGDSASPIFDQDGKVSGAIIIFRDVTKVKEAQRLKSDFSYASHQFRTPVTKALWNIEVALGEKSAAKSKENLREAYLAVESINKLSSHLLAISEVDQQRIMPKIENMKLADLIDAVLKSAETAAHKRNIRITAAPVSMIAGIKTDPQLLKKVLLEILDNAIGYSKESGEVKINLIPQGKEILIQVQDFGIGIPRDQQELIFTKFFRGKNIPPDSAGGGLGLYIAREYLKLLKGRIWFESEESIGTTFFILLPLEN